MNYIIGYGEFNSQLHLNKQDLDVINLLVINRIKEHFPQNTIYHSLDSNALF